MLRIVVGEKGRFQRRLESSKYACLLIVVEVGYGATSFRSYLMIAILCRSLS